MPQQRHWLICPASYLSNLSFRNRAYQLCPDDDDEEEESGGTGGAGEGEGGEGTGEGAPDVDSLDEDEPPPPPDDVTQADTGVTAITTVVESTNTKPDW